MSMADLALPFPADTARSGGRARLAVAATVALLFAGGGFLLHAEQQGQVIALLAAFVAVFALRRRRCPPGVASSASAAHPGTVNLTAAVSIWSSPRSPRCARSITRC